MTTSTPMMPPQRRPSNGFGTRIAAAMLVTLALAGLGGSPALALSRTGVTLPGGPIVVKPDPCLPQPQVLSFTSTPPVIALGTNATLSWNVQVGAGCNYTVALLGQSVGLQGSLAVRPILDTTYTLTLVWGPNRTLSTTAQTGVSVILPADPADPTRQLVTITAPPSIDLFLKGLKTSNTTVVVDNAVDLDLSGLDHIQILEGVRLIGGRTVVPGQPYQPGPRLYTTTAPSRLFDVQGQRVRITGLRIQGRLNIDPPEIASDESSIGVSLSGSSWNAQVDHNEIYGWSNAGVEVLGDSKAQAPAVQSSFDAAAGLLVYAATPEPALIYDNYFHHNLHTSGLGYGVVVGGKGHALIERNVFDWNRHAISGDGSDFSGFRAYRNLVLEHGGYNDWAGFWIYIQQFDMHGQDNCGVLSWFSDTQFNCGTAGHDVDIRYNSFLYTAAQAIKVRGTPQLAAVVESNVFAHEFLVDTVVSAGSAQAVLTGAVEWTETGVWVGADNQVGVTTWETDDSCDFDGDGVPDRFMTTGQTWWFSSNKGQGPWTFLNASTLQLRDLALGYFDGDGLCDVAAGGVIYSGGTTVPKQRLGPRPIPSKVRLSR